MKLFTRSVVALALLLASLAPTIAANITILVGDNYYRKPGVTTGDSDFSTVAPGDVVTFQYVGQLSHPTVSDIGAWATIPMNAASPTFTLPASLFTTPGARFPYHCSAHGAPGLGQYGEITVGPRVATPTLNARTAGIEVSVYPNPTRGQVTVKLDQKAGQDYKLRISNIIGQDVRTVALKPELTAAGLPLDLSDLRAGVYFYSLLVDGKVTSTKRLVLQN